ncbi:MULTISPECIES: SDR family NAD(P)-dependent oxidoreductase [Parachlamydia]|jgi:NAD(P)-dependent dehydrogenase (short-subunit alcohol dehydrogenase family)|uniref:SDR family NAD(P)-dependent oxidoreductase n=1 Tax=Parachlamydia TaxID=83551 RepID=UPI0001C1763B|nr:SDR family NAD(P)-dependent oxidoreductase [Parachlamydia acanthamoebae]EFB42503.1 hypothetical protein pah_c005o036 [Parachlamydia acanthamoebae str. Hall's coccus]
MSLAGKCIVIIGRSSGIGLAIAQLAVNKGFEVVIASRSQQKLDKAKEIIGSSVIVKQLDVSDEHNVKNFFSEIGHFDYLATPGSSSSTGSCLELDTSIARASFDSKFWGQYYSIKYGTPHISKNGAIVLFSGVLHLN